MNQFGEGRKAHFFVFGRTLAPDIHRAYRWVEWLAGSSNGRAPNSREPAATPVRFGPPARLLLSRTREHSNFARIDRDAVGSSEARALPTRSDLDGGGEIDIHVADRCLVPLVRIGVDRRERPRPAVVGAAKQTSESVLFAERELLLRPLLIQRRHARLHLMYLGDERGQVEVRLLAVGGARLDDMQPLTIAVLVAVRHDHSGRKDGGEQVASSVSSFDMRSLHDPLSLERVTETIGVVTLRKRDRRCEVPVELVLPREGDALFLTLWARKSRIQPGRPCSAAENERTGATAIRR